MRKIKNTVRAFAQMRIFAKTSRFLFIFISILSLVLFMPIQGLGIQFFTSYAATPAQVPVILIPAATFANFQAKPPIHSLFAASTSPQGLVPSEIKTAYHLPATGGSGTIAIISAFAHPAIASDLAVFDKAFSLPDCTTANKCLEIHAMTSKEKTDTGWSLESALDTQWAHAIAPTAKILVVEATSDSGTDLMKAVDYARAQSGVVSISMSWGGDEFAGETALDSHFGSSTVKSKSTATSSAANSITYFASSGDSGAGASWPAVSRNVIAVGGTSLAIDIDGKFYSEKAWSGSGGGISAYETEPSYQTGYSIPKANKKRAIPDVSYAADPIRGFSIYHVETPTTASKTDSKASASAKTTKPKGWYVVGGTSAGAPQWAAIAALGHSIKDTVSLAQLYADKASAVYSSFFRDITSGDNGTCGYYCTARTHYDYVTGLGSPLTYKF